VKTYYIVVLSAWTTMLTTLMATKVGQMPPCSVNDWSIPFWAFFLSAFPAFLGYMIGSERS
jgi:hypothetical protein